MTLNSLTVTGASTHYYVKFVAPKRMPDNAPDADPWQETLAMACGRSGRFCSECSGAKPPQFNGSQAPHAQTAQAKRISSARHGHRQIALVRCGEAGDNARCRTPITQKIEQPARELSSVNATARKGNEAVQIPGPVAAFCFHQRSCRQICSTCHAKKCYPTASGKCALSQCKHGAKSHRFRSPECRGVGIPMSEQVKFTVPTRYGDGIWRLCCWLWPVGYSGSAITSWRCTPRPSIPSSTTSPGLRYCGGFCPIPTPGGVPVEITSPGCRLMNWLKYDTTWATL